MRFNIKLNEILASSIAGTHVLEASAFFKDHSDIFIKKKITGFTNVVQQWRETAVARDRQIFTTCERFRKISIIGRNNIFMLNNGLIKVIYVPLRNVQKPEVRGN